MRAKAGWKPVGECFRHREHCDLCPLPILQVPVSQARPVVEVSSQRPVQSSGQPCLDAPADSQPADDDSSSYAHPANTCLVEASRREWIKQEGWHGIPNYPPVHPSHPRRPTAWTRPCRPTVRLYPSGGQGLPRRMEWSGLLTWSPRAWLLSGFARPSCHISGDLPEWPCPG